VRAVRELRALGAEVIPICCDSADAGQMQAAFNRAASHFGRLDGVIHAAAEMAPRAFQSVLATDAVTADLHFRNKAKSALVLRDIIAKQPIEFCMLVSSLSSVLGGLNFSAYAGANAFLDSLAEQQSQSGTGTRWISVDWDGWRFDGEQPNRSEYYLAPDEGASAFRRILTHSRSPQVVVSTGELEARLDRWIRLKPAETTSGDLAPAHPRPEITTQFAAPQTAVEQMIADVWQLVLGVNAVGVRDNFFELGGHSLLAIQLVSRLRDLFQAEIALTAIFDHPTLAQLAEHVQTITGNGDAQIERLAQMLDYVEQLSPEEVEALLAREAQP
jgi:acyl carrier protein